MPKILNKTIKSFDNTEIFYRISKSKKPCLFFIHGLGLNHTAFKKQQAHFSKKFTTINMDVRGHGNSKTTPNFTLETFAKDIYSILKKEKIKKAIIVGHSFGGMISLQFYKLFPQMVKALILINSSYKLSLITIRPSFLLFNYLLCTILTAIGPKHKTKPKLDLTNYKHNFQLVYESPYVTDKKIIKDCIGAMKQSNLKQTLEKINIPTLIIETKQDEIFSRISYKIMHKKIRNSKLDIIKGHHPITILDPNSINKEISKFISAL